jgi:WD40 repeat protein/tRNA A-37 threonylcarbamoyl transferase component Bud32
VPSPQNREEVLFAAALGKPPAERASFLDGACYGDPALRQRLDILLAARQKADELSAKSVPAVAATIKLQPYVEDEAVGKTIGRYKVLEKVGEGGCGVVYVAEQTEPVRRRVALKVIKLGMDTKQVVARFEAERQALAMMDHPNIAKVLDAGATEAGRPFFVMELVRGIRITDYCDQNNLSTKERLELFIKVCQAIQHAHQKGIIHRDIKPSNILVTLHDGVPVPKVIDFGIAKATEGRLTDATVYTQLHQFIGTPAYMSPEQAEMSGLDIDTRSDIYSLGVLLYELLTGRTPFDSDELMSLGLDEMRKAIREKDPVRPSTRFATLEGEDLTTTAKRRSTEISKLMHQLKGDLDWIVMKCLEKDRQRRYDTATGLAADLKRHLGNEPVVARPPSAAYKFQKAFRRNKLVFAAGTVVVIALVAGLCLAALGWRQTSVERDKALHAQAQAVVAQANETKQRELADAARVSETKLREQAQAEELVARQRAYASDMAVAEQALDKNQLGHALDLLNRQRPQPAQKDLRGWEWRYLWQQTRGDNFFTFCHQSNAVTTLAVSASGELLATGSRNGGGLELWDLRARQRLVSLTEEGSYYCQVAFSPTEPLLVFATDNGRVSADNQSSLHLWNTATRRMVAQWPLDGMCLGLALSMDGRTLLTSTSYGTKGRMTLWRVPDGTMLASYPVDQPPLGPQASAFATTPDLQLVAYGSPEGRIHILDLHSGNELWSAQASKLRVTALAFSPDGRRLASAAGYEEKDIRLWDVAVGHEIGRLQGHSAFVSSLLFWPDGKRLASSSADQTIRIWDVGQLKCLNVLRGHQDMVFRLALSPDQKTMFSGGNDGMVCVWNSPATPPPERRLIIPDNVTAFCFAPDSLSLVTLNPSGRVVRWSGAEFEQREPLLDVGGGLIRGVDLHWFHVFSRDGQFLAVGSTNGLMRVWDVRRRALSSQLTNTTGEFIPLEFLDGGEKLITGSGDMLQEWDLRTASEIQSWSASWLFATSLSPDESLMIGTSPDSHQLVVRNLAGRKNLQFDPGDRLQARSTFSPDGSRLVISSHFGSVQVWDASRWRAMTRLRGFLLAPYAMAFSSDGKRLAIGGFGEQVLRLWDAESWQELFTLESQGGNCVSAAVSPDGNTIAALDATGILQLWRAPSWEEIAAAEAKDPSSQGYGGQGKAEIKQP